MPADDLFLRACRGEPVASVPVWFMRQAGRSLPEYRAVRESHSLLEICRTPELAAEVTLQPVRRLGVDAAILFSDLVVPLLEMGVSLDVVPGKGPVVDDPFRSSADLGRLRPLDTGGIDYVNKAISVVVPELEVPLIGFAGAPFTLATYLIEGGAARDHVGTRALIYSEPETWSGLMDALADGVVSYLRGQIEAGAGAIQLFDSWIGDLSPDAFRTHAAPWLQRIVDALAADGVPIIYFGVGTSHLLEAIAGLGMEVMGVDWRVPLGEARRRCGGNAVVQGNLDPATLLAPWLVVREQARRVLAETGGTGHIFNLGHGVLPGTDPAILSALVEYVHGWEPR